MQAAVLVKSTGKILTSTTPTFTSPTITMPTRPWIALPRSPSPVLSPTSREILKRAKEKIEAGWTQEAFRRDKIIRCGFLGLQSYVQVQYCAAGAIREVRAEMGLRRDLFYDWDSAEFAVIKAIGGRSIIGWNDEKGRTKEHVIRAFEEAMA